MNQLNFSRYHILTEMNSTDQSNNHILLKISYHIIPQRIWQTQKLRASPKSAILGHEGKRCMHTYSQ